MKDEIKSILSVLLILFFFVLFSYVIQTNIGFFEKLIGDSILGMFVYVLFKVVAIVIAPVSTLPLIVVAANLWGVFLAATLSVIGWSIGCYIAFVLSREYGVDLVKKFVSLKQINKFEKKIPEENLFWIVVLIRMITPPDVVSYAIGLFSKIKTRTYVIATIIGLIPFAFVWAYLGTVPAIYQVIGILSVGIILLIVFIINRK